MRAFTAPQIVNRDVADDGGELPFLALLIVEINGENRIGDLSHFDVSEVEVFEQSAAHGVVLKP